MGNTVAQEVTQAVAFKATENAQVANLFMAFLGKMVFESAVRKRPIEGVSVGKPWIDGSTIKFKVAFSGLVPAVGVPVLDRRFDDVRQFVDANSAGMALAMRRNPAFQAFMISFFDMAEALCRHKGWRYRDLAVSAAFLDKDDIMVATLGNGAAAGAH